MKIIETADGMKLLALSGFLISCVFGGNPSSEYSEFRSIAQALGGYDHSTNHIRMNTLFSEGRPAIPALVEVLDSKNHIWAHCGAYSLQSETVEVDFNSPVFEGHGRFTGEIALYLIEAIVRSDYYFAQTCSLEIDGRSVLNSTEIHERIQGVASALKERSPSELESLTSESLEGIMRKHGLRFPKREF